MSSSSPSPTRIGEPAQTMPGLHGWPLLRLGFRPFYIGATLLACLSVPLWVGLFLGHMKMNLALPPLLWHGHEMVFGFAAGVIAGFLLTAVRAWTGFATARGPLLGGLALLWLAARVAALTGPYWLFAVLDVALLPIVAVLLLRVLAQAANKRNVPLVSLLLLLTLANLCFHLSVAGVVALPATSALYAGMALVVMVISVMTGRVVPMFTRNVTPGMVVSISRPFELTVLAVTALTLVLWVLGAPAVLTALLCAVTAVLHVWRLCKWQPWVTLKRPILWILHLSYAWLPIGFVMLALAELGQVRMTMAVHAIAVGLIGGLIIGMVTRTARGHTGRPLKASVPETLAYALVLIAAVFRALVPAIWPSAYVMALGVSSSLWAVAFAIYLVIYTPWLLSSRLDGKDG